MFRKLERSMYTCPFNLFVHSEKCLFESTKFWLVQPQSMVIIRTTKFLVERTKFFG